MEALGVALIVLFLLTGAAVLIGDAWFQRGIGPLPWIARRFGIKLEPKERSGFWSRRFRR
jgi:hypothetical protein